MTTGLLSKENILFFVIVGIFFLIAVVVCFFIIRSFFRFIANIFKKLFHKEEIKSIVDLELQKSKEERQKIEQDKVSTATVSGPSLQYNQSATNSAKKEPEISQEQKFEEKNQKEIEKEKGIRSIEEQLKDFKKEHNEEKETLASKMPSRGGEEVDNFQKIRIPRAKKLEPEAPVKGEEAGKYSIKEGEVSLGKMGAITNGGSIFGVAATKPGETFVKEKTSFFEKPEFIKDDIGPHSSHKNMPKSMGTKDNSIFEGKGEISRTNLREKLEGSKMYEAERSVGLTLSPIERSRLEKEVFSQNLGQNISKSDLRWGIKKLNDKMVGSKNMAEKGKIRKEIKFFKKIGGIK
jgi:hypothetical protein